MKTENTFIYNIFTNESVKVGDIITFNTHCGEDRENFKGVVSFMEKLGFVVIIDGVIYQVRRMININKIND